MTRQQIKQFLVNILRAQFVLMAGSGSRGKGLELENVSDVTTWRGSYSGFNLPIVQIVRSEKISHSFRKFTYDIFPFFLRH